MPGRNAGGIARLGRLAVLAPHPDDESLGCGGLIALARRFGLPVTVIFISDGGGSHPNSRQFPPPALCRLRESEARAAAAALGVAAADQIFFRLPDRAVPASPGDVAFRPTVARLAALLRRRAIETVACSSRRDRHCDHRACYRLLRAAARRLPGRLRLLEYAIWSPDALGDRRALRLDIGAVVERKRRAIACHRSQLGGLIVDDPAGFGLSPALRRRCERPQESFRESVL